MMEINSPESAATCRCDRAAGESPCSDRRVATALAVTGASMPPMPTRRQYKPRPGSYRGERKLVGGRVWTEIVEQVDEARGTTSQTDWVAAALLVALEHPDAQREALKRIERLDPRTRANKQLSLAEEVLDRTA